MKYSVALLIENENIAVELINRLEIHQFSVTFLGSEEEIQPLFMRNSPNLLMIQGQANEKKLEAIKKCKMKSIPVVAVGEWGDNNSDIFLKNGADEYLQWPATSIQIMKRVNTVRKLRMVADDIKKAVERKAQELTEVQSVMIESLAALAEYRDTDTRGHIRRTQNYVNALAQELRKLPKYAEILREEEINLIYLSVPLHDIGKVGVRDEILLKPGKLTEEEFEVMKQHTVIGYNTIMSAERKLNNNAFLRYAADVAYTHQEKWDGSGYPRGLSGEGIPLIGRIMAVADVYDALVSKRVYKDAMDHESARNIILEGSGKHFDPEIVKAFQTVEDTFRNIETLCVNADEVKERYDSDTKCGAGHTVRNILMVDDSKLTLSIFSNQLTNQGYHVEAVTDAAIAYELFMKNDLI